MRRRDEKEYVDEFMRRLDEGIVQEGRATVRVPLLDLDLLGVEVRSFVTTCENYPLEAPILAEELEDVSLLDVALSEPEEDGLGENIDTQQENTIAPQR